MTLPRNRRRSFLVGVPSALAVLAAIERGLGVPDRDLPALAPGERRERDLAFEARLKPVRDRCDAIADALGLEPSVLATRGLIEAALRRREAGEPLEGTPGLRRWQVPLLAPVLP